MAKVLVLDGKSIATIAIIRSLARKGIEVACGEEFRTCIGFFSKHVKKRVVYPSPERKPDSFIQKMYDVAKKDGYDLIMPVADETTILLAKYKHELSRFTTIPVAEYETIMKARDKGETIELAVRSGVPCPKTYFPDRQSFSEIKEHLKSPPVLIKPRQSSGSRGIRLVDSLEKLEHEYEQVTKLYGPALVQEYIPTEEGRYALDVLFDRNHELKAGFVLKGIRGYPLKFGPMILATSVYNSDVFEYGLKLLKALNWYGFAQVDFVIDRRDSKPKLMEVNPRFVNNIALDIQSGIDFPYMLYKMATVGEVDPLREYKAGVRWRWLLPQDILWLWAAPNKVQAFRDFVKFREEDLHYAIASLSDPGPILGTVLQSLKFLASKEKRDFVFKRGQT